MRPGITQFPVDVFLNLPAVAPAGSFLVCDPLGWVATRNGTVPKYAYALIGQTAFYRINLEGAPALMRMADPPSGAGGLAFGAGTCAAWDPSNRYIWVVGPGQGGADDVWSGYYDTASGTWTSVDAGASFDALLGALWGTDGAMVSPDTIYGANSSNWLYVRGSGLNTFYRYDKLNDLWEARAVPGVVGGAGVSLVWKPGGNSDLIRSSHGGGSAAMVDYTITGNAWAPYVPATAPWTETPATGTAACSIPSFFGGYWRLNATGQVFSDSPIQSMSPLGRIYGPDGVATVGNKLCAYEEGGIIHILALLHGSSQIQRIRVVA